MNPTPEMLGKRVNVWFNHTAPDAPPDATGELIGYFDHPTIIVRSDDGKQSHWSTQLRIEMVASTPEQKAALLLRNEVNRVHEALATATRGTERPATAIALIQQLNDLRDIITAAQERAAHLWAQDDAR